MNFSSDLLNLNSKTPGFSIIIEGKDVTTVLDARLIVSQSARVVQISVKLLTRGVKSPGTRQRWAKL